MKTIAIDFDGVIHKYSKGWHDGTAYDEPNSGAFEYIKFLMDKGYIVFIFSARNTEQIQDWFGRKQSGICTEIIKNDAIFWNTKNVLGITNRKFPAVAYIDDRAVPFISFEKLPKKF